MILKSIKNTTRHTIPLGVIDVDRGVSDIPPTHDLYLGDLSPRTIQSKILSRANATRNFVIRQCIFF